MDMPQQYNWTDEDTERLIGWRRENEDAVRGFETFIKDHALEGKVEAPFVKKKWENLKQKYKELKAPRTGVRTEGGEPTAASWKWFGAMDEVLGDRPSITCPVLITSSVAPPAAVASPPSPPSQALGVSWGKPDGWVTLFRELDERRAHAEERADRREREAQEREEKIESERREDEIRSMEKREREWREWMDVRMRDERREREERDRESRAREDKLMAMLEKFLEKK